MKIDKIDSEKSDFSVAKCCASCDYYREVDGGVCLKLHHFAEIGTEDFGSCMEVKHYHTCNQYKINKTELPFFDFE